jgi:hypothetical protein
MLNFFRRFRGYRNVCVHTRSTMRTVAFSSSCALDVRSMVSPEGLGTITLSRERTLNALDAGVLHLHWDLFAPPTPANFRGVRSSVFKFYLCLLP